MRLDFMNTPVATGDGYAYTADDMWRESALIIANKYQRSAAIRPFSLMASNLQQEGF